MPQPIAPAAIHELTGVSSPALSPDGDRVAFVRSRVDRDTMEVRSQVMMVALPDGKPVVFTQGPSDAGPRFAPDGRSLAFLRPDEKRRKQLWLMPVHGGEGRQFTDAPGGVRGYAWSPDAMHIAFVSAVDPGRLPDDHDPRTDPRVRVVKRIRYRHDESGWLGDAFLHIFVVDASSGETRQLTDGEGDDTSPVWSPDGTELAFVSDRGAGRDTTHHSWAFTVPPGGGEPRKRSDGLFSVGAIAWSPDGSSLAVVGSDDPEMWDSRQTALFALTPGKAPRRLMDDAFVPVQPAPELRWADDGSITLAADSRGESFLCAVDADNGRLEKLAGGAAQYLDFALDKSASQAGIVAAEPGSPAELLLVDATSRTKKWLTAYNREYLQEHPAGRMEKFSFARAGMGIESRVILPADIDPSRKYPVVLDIHGGPNGRFHDGFDLTQQVLASAGYVVLAVNPRGSSSYGAEFAKAVLGDWGGEDYLDIMAAVDELCVRPYVDEGRLGVHGYSYGGYMSAWIVGHTARFKAAVVGAPCINLHSMYGTSDIGVSFGELNWGGSPEEAREAMVERSPLTYAAKVETPLLLMHGEDDLRCPIGQSEEYFAALKRLGKEVELARFPGAGHLFRRSGHAKLQEEYLTRMLAWLGRHLDVRSPSEAAGQIASAGDS